MWEAFGPPAWHPSVNLWDRHLPLSKLLSCRPDREAGRAQEFRRRSADSLVRVFREF
jgi:hypothetical protein